MIEQFCEHHILKYPLLIKDENTNIKIEKGLIEATHCPTGCMLIKRGVLEKYKDTNYVWIDDRVDYCRDGDAVGLKTFCMDWPYNRHYKGNRVKSWKELYDTTFKC